VPARRGRARPARRQWSGRHSARARGRPPAVSARLAAVWHPRNRGRIIRRTTNAPSA